MAYQVLARKWRPKNFADLVGQEHVVKALRNALDKGRLHHAYLLTGTRGVGKTTIARILAKSLNCENAVHGEPCGVCESCTQIDAGRYVDLLEIDAASNTGIDNIREVLENAQYAPTAGKYKVYIIDEVHMLSKSAFNAMLKTLEEPPEHVKFILATTDPHKVPVTVLSRCLQFVLRNMTAQQVADHLAYVLNEEGIAYEPAALQLLGRAAAGSMRDALSLLDQAIAMGSGQVGEADVRQMIGAVDKRYLYELLDSIARQDGQALMAKAQEMAARAIGFDNALSELAVLLQRLALLKTVPSAIAQDDPEYAALTALAAQLADEQIQLYYQCAIHGKQDLGVAPDEYAGFVMTLLRMLAFAPMAARAQPENAEIHGTALQNPENIAVTEAVPAKKPWAEPSAETVIPSGTARAANAGKAAAGAENNADLPPWEEQDAAMPSENGIINSGTGGFSDGGKVSADAVEPLAEPATQAPIRAAENVAEQTVVPAENHRVNEMETAASPAEHTEAAFQTASAPQERFSETARPSENSASAASQPTPRERAADHPFDERTYSADTVEAVAWAARGEDEWPQEMPPFDELPNEESASVPPAEYPFAEVAESEEDETEAQFIPLPPFAGDNWFEIVKRLSPRLGGAQMLAQDCAWVSFEEAENRLILSLNGHSGITVKKEFFDKIRSVLADAYELPDLQLRTVEWQENQGWETPMMRKNRLKAAGLIKAQMALENDAGCKKVMQFFDCEVWKRGSIELLENMD
ncbi:MAG: DNA polymerase III subunit gamma/tau [Neisseria sp.]|nr:DNA polymerase III subunit gamma/tau [Neisseria sp.]